MDNLPFNCWFGALGPYHDLLCREAALGEKNRREGVLGSRMELPEEYSLSGPVSASDIEEVWTWLGMVCTFISPSTIIVLNKYSSAFWIRIDENLLLPNVQVFCQWDALWCVKLWDVSLLTFLWTGLPSLILVGHGSKLRDNPIMSQQATPTNIFYCGWNVYFQGLVGQELTSTAIWKKISLSQ